MYSCWAELFEIELIIHIKMDLALNNLQRLICHKTQPTIHIFYSCILWLLCVPQMLKRWVFKKKMSLSLAFNEFCLVFLWFCHFFQKILWDLLFLWIVLSCFYYKLRHAKGSSLLCFLGFVVLWPGSLV